MTLPSWLLRPRTISVADLAAILASLAKDVERIKAAR
jgi:hypothetical protein